MSVRFICSPWVYYKRKYIIPCRYKAGSVIDVTVRLTFSHKGHFEFNLCPLKTEKELETDECFNKYPLSLADDSGYKYPIPTFEAKDYIVKLVLPKSVTCKQCVIRLELRTKSHIEFYLILIFLNLILRGRELSNEIVYGRSYFLMVFGIAEFDSDLSELKFTI